MLCKVYIVKSWNKRKGDLHPQMTLLQKNNDVMEDKINQLVARGNKNIIASNNTTTQIIHSDS
jgi:hypothetical protein